MFDVTIWSAILGGVLTFFAPCTLPILPAFLSYLLGGKHSNGTTSALLVSVGFSLGFSAIFFLFGIASGTFGQLLIQERLLLGQIGGILVIVFGLMMLGVIPSPRISGTLGMLPPGLRNHGVIGSIVLGMLFALGWSPCLGPVLGTILILAAQTGSALSGGILLLFYSLGFALPFIVLALTLERVKGKLLFLSRYGHVMNLISGILLILLGIFLTLGNYGVLMNLFGGILDITKYDWVVNKL